MAHGKSAPVILPRQLEFLISCLSAVSGRSWSCGLVYLDRNVFCNSYLEYDLFVLTYQTGRLAEILEAPQGVDAISVILNSKLFPYFDCFIVECHLKNTLWKFHQIHTAALHIGPNKNNKKKKNTQKISPFYQLHWIYAPRLMRQEAPPYRAILSALHLHG